MYIDVLLCLNLIINYLILMSAGSFLHRKKRRLRLICGALFGSLCSLIILLPPLSNLLNFAVKLLVSSVICLISFGFSSKKDFLVNTAAFFLMSFLFCGVMLALWFIFTPRGMVINNSTVYFNISPIYLIVSALVTYLITRLVCRITGRREVKNLYINVKIENLSNVAELKGKLDTGCNLKEPFSGSPVIVCGAEKIRSVAPERVIEYQKCPVGAGAPVGVRIIPYKTIDSDGLLPCFKPDKVYINGKPCFNEIYIAAAEGEKISGDADCLINPLCIE